MSWKLYLNGKDAWDSMLADCETAEKSIDVEQYIFNLDNIGRRFIEVLKEKREQGIKVRILCDGVGSYSFKNSDELSELTRKGIQVKFFNPVKPWRVGNFSSWFLRDHRKLLIIDKNILHTGGVGIDDRMSDWRDTNVRLEGEVAREACAVFEQVWRAPRRKFLKFDPKISEETEFSFLVNSPRYKSRYIYKSLLRAIKNAKNYLYITTPYFVPSIRIFRLLNKAARRGVDVRLLLPESSDVYVADIAAGSYFALALRAGVKVYLYDPNVVLHSKIAICDNNWASVGSANLDNLSMLFNHEGNIISRNSEFIKELRGQFLADLKHSKSLTRSEWKNRSIFRKILEFITWPLHQIL
jgi:cardiolipin synthase